MRGKPKVGCNALNNCEIETCPSAIERSRFGSTLNSTEFTAKGGIKDRKKGISGDFTQIAFLEKLLRFGESGIMVRSG